MDDYGFDLDAWTSEVRPQDSLFPYGPFPMTSPRGVVSLEYLRARVARMCDLGAGVPADVFVLGWGKSPHRDMTKIDGIPYRPADREWPMSSHGKPMTFLAQYRFVESKDIVGQLPGDLLLVFIEDRELAYDSPQEFLRFEWYPTGLSDLCVPGGLPDPAWTFAACYGLRNRTVDYSEDVPVEVLRECVPEWRFSESTAPENAEAFSRVLGVKIGGLPTFPYDAKQRERIPPGARFLCSLSSVYPALGVEHPWLNVAEPIPVTARLWPEMYLDFMDGFVLDFWIDDAGEVSWVVDFE